MFIRTSECKEGPVCVVGDGGGFLLIRRLTHTHMQTYTHTHTHVLKCHRVCGEQAKIEQRETNTHIRSYAYSLTHTHTYPHTHTHTHTHTHAHCSTGACQGYSEPEISNLGIAGDTGQISAKSDLQSLCIVFFVIVIFVVDLSSKY